jgi:hypothetical protein
MKFQFVLPKQERAALIVFSLARAEFACKNKGGSL